MAQAVAVAAGIINVAGEAEKLEKGLYNVKVSRKNVTEAERAMQGELFDKWEETYNYSKSNGVLMSRFDDFLKHLSSGAYGVNAQEIEKLKGLWFMDSTQNMTAEFKFQAGPDSKAKYIMMVAAKRSDGEKFDCIHLDYSILFKLAPKVVVTDKKHSTLFGLINWSTSNTVTYEQKLGMKNMEALKDYFRFKALEGFRKEGVIKEIGWTD